MAVTDVHGTQTAVISTEHTLADTSAAGSYQGVIDLVNMASGDVVEIRVYHMVLTSGTRRVAYYQRYDGAQPTDAMIAESLAISTALADSGAVRLTLKQTAGTGRNFPWALNKIG